MNAMARLVPIAFRKAWEEALSNKATCKLNEPIIFMTFRFVEQKTW